MEIHIYGFPGAEMGVVDTMLLGAENLYIWIIECNAGRGPGEH